MAYTYDAIVIGAGVMGASVAMNLTRAAAGRVLVLEKSPGAGFGSTGRSSACIRQTYSQFHMNVMAREALEQFRNWRDFTGVADPKANFVHTGVIFLVHRDDPHAERILAQHHRAGVDAAILDLKELRERYPDLDYCSVPVDLDAESHECRHETRALYEPAPGFADPVGTTEDMLQAAVRDGATVLYKRRVSRVLQAGGRVKGVEAEANGATETFHAPVVVNCAGPWGMTLNEMAGVPLSWRLEPIRAQMVSKSFSEPLQGHLPMVSDLINGMYFRREAAGSQIVVGSLREDEEQEVVPDPDDYNERADAPYREEKLVLLQHRLPVIRSRGTVTSYAGLYTVNQDDYHPIVDESELAGFHYVLGFSGHGFKLSPVIGTLVARQVLGHWGRIDSDVPPDFLSREREPLMTAWGGVTA